MSKKLKGLITIGLIVATFLLTFPKTVFADEGDGGSEKEVNGYHVKLVFVEPVKVGENQFHIQITDAMDMPVTDAEVEVSAMPAEGMDTHTDAEVESEAPSVGEMTSNSGDMDGMDMAAEEPATGVMTSNEPAADAHGEETLSTILEPTTEAGEYAGELHFEKSGEWMLNVHFTVNGETTEVEFPFEIARSLGMNYGVLAGFLGINATVLTSAAVLKRKSKIIRK